MQLQSTHWSTATTRDGGPDILFNVLARVALCMLVWLAAKFVSLRWVVHIPKALVPSARDNKICFRRGGELRCFPGAV